MSPTTIEFLDTPMFESFVICSRHLAADSSFSNLQLSMFFELTMHYLL